MIWWSSPSSPSEKVRRSVWKLASRRRRRGPKMPEPWRCDANENCQPGWSWWLWQLLSTQTRFINIGPLFQYFRMPPPLHGGPINHEQPDYNRLSGSHKVITANLRKPSATPFSPLKVTKTIGTTSSLFMEKVTKARRPTNCPAISLWRGLTQQLTHTQHIQVKNKV